YGYPFKVLRPCLPILEDDGRLSRQTAVSVAGNPRLGPVQRKPKTLAVNRLEQIIQSAAFKGLQAVLIVGGHKDDQRDSLGRKAGQHVKAADLGHLNVKEYKIRPQLINSPDRLLPSGAFRDHANFRIA